MTLIWNDQVTNDWTSLEQIVTSDSEFSKYRYELSKTSFYNSISTSVIFGFSASALHWLQNKPKFDSLSLSNSLFAIHGNLLAFDNQLRVLLMKQAQNDWILILKQRAKELVKF